MWLIPRYRALLGRAEYLRARRACTRLHFSKPPLVEEWERRMAAFLAVPQAAAVQSGLTAFRHVFEHLGLEPGAEVIVPTYGPRQLPDLIKKLGVKPIPADVEPHTLNVTVPSVAVRITPRTRAIVVSHAFGAPAPVDGIVALADAHNIPVIEDCGEALGAVLKGRPVGGFGYAAVFRFDVGCPVNTHGGGMVASRDADLIRHIHGRTQGQILDGPGLLRRVRRNCREQRCLRTGFAWPVLVYQAIHHGEDGRRTGDPDGPRTVGPVETRYSPVQARWGLARLSGLEQRLLRRRERAELLESLLHSSIYLQQVLPGTTSAWSRMVVVLPRRPGAVRRELILHHGIDAAMGDEITHECARFLGRADCPGAVDVYFHALALPMFDGITERQIRRIARALNGAVR